MVYVSFKKKFIPLGSIPTGRKKQTFCKFIGSFFIGAVCLISPINAFATESILDAPFKINLNLYGWLPDAPATITVDGKDIIEVPESFSTIIDSAEGLAMFEFDIHKGPLVFFVNTIYYKGSYDDDFTGPITDLDREFKLREEVTTFKYGVGYEFGPFQADDSNITTTITPWVGGFYFHDDWSLDIKPEDEPFGGKVSGTYEYNTPLAGIVSRSRLSEDWSLVLTYARGGWDVDNVEKIYDVWGNLSYHFKMGDTPAKAYFGYRYLDFKWEQAPTALHLTVKGPLIGIGWQF